MKKTSLWIPVLSAICLCVISILTSYLPYKEWDSAFLILFVLLGAILGFLTIFIHNKSLKTSLFRILLLYLIFFVLFGMGGEIGFWRWLDKTMGIIKKDATGRASGLGIAFVLLASFVGGVSAVVLSIIKNTVEKLKDR